MDGVKFVVAIFSFHLLKSQIGYCKIDAPSRLSANVGNDVYFMWNSTIKDIVEVTWGLYKSDTNSVSPNFMTTNILTGNKFNAYLNGSRYEGRVEYVGDIRKGQAWFLLKNVSSDDAVVYAAKITEGPAVSPTLRDTSQVKLDVEVPTPAPTTVGPTKTVIVTSIASPFPNGTDNTTTEVTTTAKSTPKPHHLNPGEIVGIVIGVLVVIAIIVGLIVWYVKKSKNNGSNGSNNKSGPLEMDKPTGDGNRTSPEA